MNPQDVDIRTLLPQQPPVVMVDRLLAADMTTAETSLLVRPDNIFVEHGMLKAYALIENMAQTCAAQLGYVDKYIHGHDAVRIGYIGSIKNLKVESAPMVGETLRTRITVLQDILDMKLVMAESFVGERLIASAEMKIALSGERIDV